MDRVLEPEYMDTADEAESYDAMDHAGPNAAFVERLVALGARGHMLDIGTGPAHIPLLLAARDPEATIVALDAAAHMVRVAERNLAKAPPEVAARVRLVLGDAKGLPFPDATFDVVFSNTILHHIPDPRPFLAEAFRVLKPGGVLLVRDLFRPADEATVDRLVATYAAGADAEQRALFRASLCAALTVDELRAIADQAGLARAELVVDTDRHMSLQLRNKVETPRLTIASSRQRREEQRQADDERHRREPETAERPGFTPLPVGDYMRPPRWARRAGAATAEAKQLARQLEAIERALDRGERGRALKKLFAELPEGPLLDANWHLAIGRVALDADQPKLAERHLLEARRRHPDWIEVTYALGRLWALNERFDEMTEAWLAVRAHDLRAPRPEWRLSEDQVVEAAEGALARLPEEMRKHLRNLPIIVTDAPSEPLVREGIDPRILGLISGTPLPEKRHALGDRPDLDVVQLFVRNIERAADGPERERMEVEITVVHEVMHYFGVDEDEMGRFGLE